MEKLLKRKYQKLDVYHKIDEARSIHKRALALFSDIKDGEYSKMFELMEKKIIEREKGWKETL
jgi:hypothetical protein